MLVISLWMNLNKFYLDMPLRWRTNFINSSQDLHESSLEVIKTYMIQQEYQTNAHWKKTHDANTRKQMGGHKHQKESSQSSSKPNTSTRGNKNGKRKWFSNNNDYPIHGPAHKWGKCHQNQYSDNFNPKRTTNFSHFTNSSQPNQSGQRNRSANSLLRPPQQVYYHNTDNISHRSNDSSDSYSPSNGSPGITFRSTSSNSRWFNYHPNYHTKMNIITSTKTVM